MAGIGGQHRSIDLRRLGGVSGVERRIAFRSGEIELRRQQAVDERSDLCFRERPGEPVDLFPILESDDRWDALHPELLGELRVGIDVELGEQPATAPFGGCALEHGTEHLAGSAPLRPEIDDDRDLMRRLDHRGCEIRGADVDDT